MSFLNLSAIDNKIADKRKELAECLDAKTKLFSQIDDIDAKASVEGADKDQLDKDRAEALKALSQAGDNARLIEGDLAQLNAERASREEHNRQQALANQERQVSPEAPNKPAEGLTGSDIRVKDLDNATKDHDIVCLLRALHLGNASKCGPWDVLNGRIGSQYENKRLLSAMMASLTTTGVSSIVPTIYSNRMVELLRAKTVIRRMAGLRQIPLPGGNLTMPRQTGSSTASYTGEMVNITPSDPTVGNLSLAGKKLTATVIQSGELLRRSDPSSDLLVRDDLIKTVARREDLAFIRGTRSSTAPGGLKYWADQAAATQAIAANGTVNLANISADLAKLQTALANADTPMENLYWVFHPRTRIYLANLRDGNGNKAFPEMADGLLQGYPFLETTQIPINLGVGTNESEVYFVDASEYIIADEGSMMLDVSTEAAYWDGSAVQAAFTQDAAVFRLITSHDSIMRHNTSVAYLSAVKWF